MLVKIVCDRKLTTDQFHETLIASVKRYFGEVGLTRIDPRIIRFDGNSLTAIVSCDRNGMPEFESSMTLIQSYAESPVSVLVLRVSGTVKGAARRGK